MQSNLLNLTLLRKWFFLFRRQLPWRENPSPYMVWISEVMLQQTQVAVVIPYFKKWMHVFPSVHALAQASLPEVIKVWEGLGYYSRARHLHEGAVYLIENHGGKIPEEAHLLKKVKGLGPYTIGAIQSFAFKQKAAAVDGNVLRVIARLFAIETPVNHQTTYRHIQQIVESLLPKIEPWIVMEALIELGALVCKKKPDCSNCPLNVNCLAFHRNQTERLPKKGKKIPITFLHRCISIIQSERKILLKQEKKGKVMADLWEFPYLEMTQPVADILHFQSEIEKGLSLKLSYQHSFPKVSHSFTRYKALLYPHLWNTKKTIPISGYEWIPKKELTDKPFSSGHRRILQNLLTH